MKIFTLSLILFFCLVLNESCANAVVDMPERSPIDNQLAALRQERNQKAYEAIARGDTKTLAQILKTVDDDMYPIPKLWARDMNSDVREMMIREELQRAVNHRYPFSESPEVLAGRQIMMKLISNLPKDLTEAQHEAIVRRQIDLTTSVLMNQFSSAPMWSYQNEVKKKEYELKIRADIQALADRTTKTIVRIKELEELIEAQSNTSGAYRSGAVVERLEADLMKEVLALHHEETELMLYSEMARSREYADLKNFLDSTFVLSAGLPAVLFVPTIFGHMSSAVVIEAQVLSVITHVFGGLLALRLKHKYGETQVEKNYWNAMANSASAVGVSTQMLAEILSKYSCAKGSRMKQQRVKSQEGPDVRTRVGLEEEPTVRSRIESDDAAEAGSTADTEYHIDPPVEAKKMRQR